jgi:hypothetical protein
LKGYQLVKCHCFLIQTDIVMNIRFLAK